ncbi:MAG: PP2C family serine/threonine-protein phosphatase [Candidatus Binataceae bacterium]
MTDWDPKRPSLASENWNFPVENELGNGARRIDDASEEPMVAPNEATIAFDAWRIAAHSVRGAAHIKAELPNQDAVEFWPPESNDKPPLILAVSDGHGSARHFRSARGAAMAVATAIATLREFNQQAAGREFAQLQTAMDALPAEVVARWRAAVEADLNADPLGIDELAKVEAHEGEASRQSVEADPVLAYGATLLATLVGNGFILFLQLGDGDVLCVDAAGTTSRLGLRDPRLTGNYSTSLCQAKAPEWMRTHLMTEADAWPALILMSSDGYANSFVSEDDFLQIGHDYFETLRTRGLHVVAAELPQILQHASENGNGDDISLGILTRLGDTACASATTVAVEQTVSSPDVRRTRPAHNWRLLFALIVMVMVLTGLAFLRPHVQVRKFEWWRPPHNLAPAPGAHLSRELLNSGQVVTRLRPAAR